jgi:hypothetical protein
MDNDLPTPAEPDRRPAETSSGGAPDDQRAPAEPRTLGTHSVRDLVSKHANDRRTLDRVLARMRRQ